MKMVARYSASIQAMKEALGRTFVPIEVQGEVLRPLQGQEISFKEEKSFRF